MKTAGYKKLLADAEYFITCKDQYADIIIDGKIKQGAKLLVSFAEQYCEEKMKEQMLKFLIWFKTEVARNGALLSVLNSNDDIMNGFLDQTNKQ